MKCMKVYISGPITGTSDYMKRFAEAETLLTDAGLAVYNPAKYSAVLPEETEYSDYMTIAFALLSVCDAIYMLPGWENSNGATAELHYANVQGKIVMFPEGGKNDTGNTGRSFGNKKGNRCFR